MKTKMHFSFRVDIWDDAGDGFVERLRYEIDPQRRGEIPRTTTAPSDSQWERRASYAGTASPQLMAGRRGKRVRAPA